MRIAQIEENNGHTLIAQQIRDASIPSVVDARPASVSAISSSLPPAAAPEATPVFDPPDHSVPQAGVAGEGEATEFDGTAAEQPPQDATIAPHGIAERSSEPVAFLMPPAALSHANESPSTEPSTGQLEVISQRSASLTPTPPSNSLAAPEPNTEALFALLAWETTNVPVTSLRVEPAHSDSPPVTPLDEELLLGDARTAEPSASSAERSTPLQLEYANGLDTHSVDELFGWNHDLLESPDLFER
jgi:hypothetical protein